MSVKVEVRSRRYPEELFGWLIFHYMPEQRHFRLPCFDKVDVRDVTGLEILNATVPVVDFDWGRRVTGRGREIPFLQCSIDDLPLLMRRDNFRPVSA